MYKIFRITADGYLKDIGYRGYHRYLDAEKVVKGLKKTYPERKFLIFNPI